MANSFVSGELVKKQEAIHDSYSRSMFIIGGLFFIFAFVSWLYVNLIPYLKIACQLTKPEASLISIVIYTTYLIMPIPTTWILKRTGFKKGMSAGLFIISIGCLILIPAAANRMYPVFLLGLFVQSSGIVILQTASNPYITILGPRESAAARICIMGICHKLAVVIAPIILSSILLTNSEELVNHLNSIDVIQREAELEGLAARVITPYIIMAATLIVLAILLLLSGLPEIDTDQESETLMVSNARKTSIFQFPHLMLGVIASFLYIGVEQIANFAILNYALKFHHLPPEIANQFPYCTLIAMISGYILGIITIPRFISQDKALKISAIAGVVFVLGTIFTNGIISVFIVSLLGLANAVIWPAIWPLAIADLGRFTKIGSSLLIMGISGGAVSPLIFKPFAANFNYQLAYALLIPCYLFIWYFATKGHKVRV